jgi:hypothetical protein
MSHYEDIPKQIRIGPHDYQVELMPTEWSRAETGEVATFGLVSEFDQVIRLRDDMKSRSMAMEVALHEIAHAILRPLDLEIEEMLAQVIGVGLTQVIRDNPNLLEWLMEKKQNESKCKCGGQCGCNPSPIKIGYDSISGTMDTDLFGARIPSERT